MCGWRKYGQKIQKDQKKNQNKPSAATSEGTLILQQNQRKTETKKNHTH